MPGVVFPDAGVALLQVLPGRVQPVEGFPYCLRATGPAYHFCDVFAVDLPGCLRLFAYPVSLRRPVRVLLMSDAGITGDFQRPAFIIITRENPAMAMS